MIRRVGMSMRLGGWAYLVFLLAGRAAFAQVGDDWARTFEPAAVATYVPGTEATILVVGAGPRSDSVRAAAWALEQALAGSGKTKRVMNDQSLGSVEALDDGAIVVKCRPFPVAHIAVVRVFMSAGAPSQAVVTVYDRQGTVTVAFAVQAGLPLEPAAGVVGAGQGVSRAAASSVSSVTKAEGAGDEPGESQYDRRYVWFRDLRANSSLTAVLGEGTYAFQGKNAWPLQGAAFYVAVGRRDLADRYNSTSSAKSVLTWGGAGGVLVGILIASGDDPGASDEGGGEDSVALGLVFVVAGTVSLIAGLALEPHPVTAAQARELADKHNARLRGEARVSGLPSRYFSAPTLKLHPFLGGLGMTATF